MGIYEKLSKIQQEMKVPKSLRNTFGGYNYRNAEGILEEFKPYEGKYNVCLVVSDDVMECGGRVYVKATARLIDLETLTEVTATAYAREAETKKGMDDSQITGTASSYARKYALNGLFLLDDTKDADTDENRIEREARSNAEQTGRQKIGAAKAKALQTKLEGKVDINKLLTQYKVASLEDLTEEQHLKIIKLLEKK